MPEDRPEVKLTGVDVTVLTVIVLFLITLLLPALQIPTNRIRRMQCKSNLRQLGTALHNYNTIWGCFSPGMTYGTHDAPPDFSTGDFGEVRFYCNAFTALLLYCENPGGGIMHEELDENQPWYRQNLNLRSPDGGVSNLEWFASPVLCCPGNAYEQNPLQEEYLYKHLDAMLNWFPEPIAIGLEFGRADYLLCKGVSDAFCSQPGLIRTWEQINADPELGGFADNERGMFDISLPPESPGEGSSYVCKVSLVTDGLSNTFAIGEGAQGPNWPICDRDSGSDRCEPLCWDAKDEPSLCSEGKADTPLPIYQFWIGSPNVTSGVRGGLYIGSVFGCTLEPLNKSPVTHAVMQTDPADATNCRASIDWDGDGPVNANTKTGVDRVSNFRSDHPGGANFLFADGAVKFVQDGIDPTTYRALSTISGHEIPGPTLP